MDAPWYHRVRESSFILLVSGPDRSGKSTVVEKLGKLLMAQTVRLSTPQHMFDDDLDDGEKASLHKLWLHSDWLAEIYSLQNYYRERLKIGLPTRVVVDRCYHDEWAYSEVFERSTWDLQVYENLEVTFKALGAMVLFVLERPGIVEPRWTESFSFDVYKGLYGAFMDVQRDTALPSRIYVPSEGELRVLAVNVLTGQFVEKAVRA